LKVIDAVEDQIAGRFEPVAFPGSTASRTVTVAARVVHRGDVVASTAAVLVTAQGCSSAE